MNFNLNLVQNVKDMLNFISGNHYLSYEIVKKNMYLIIKTKYIYNTIKKH